MTIFQNYDFLTEEGIFSCEGIYDDYEGFRVLIRGEKINSPMIRIKFDFYYLYQIADESYRLRSIDNYEKEPEGVHPIYVVNNSKYLNWFHKETYGIYTDENITHYAIYTSNTFIDILSGSEPVIEKLGGND